MNHEQEALERAQAGQFDAAQFHATMYAAQQIRLSNLLALACDQDLIGPDAHEDARQQIVEGLNL